MFARVVIKHQGKSHTFDENSGALEAMADEYRRRAQEEAATQSGGGSAAAELVPPLAQDSRPPHSAVGSHTDAAAPDSRPADSSASANAPKPGAKKSRHRQRWRDKKRHGKGPPKQPVNVDEGVDGHFYWFPQRWLQFGSKARPPRVTRPVMLVALRNGPSVPVLPCTTKEKQGQKTRDFFLLEKWSNWFPDVRGLFNPSWMYRGVETKRRDDFGKEIGRLPDIEREKVLRWLRGETAA